MIEAINANAPPFWPSTCLRHHRNYGARWRCGPAAETVTSSCASRASVVAGSIHCGASTFADIGNRRSVLVESSRRPLRTLPDTCRVVSGAACRLGINTSRGHTVIVSGRYSPPPARHGSPHGGRCGRRRPWGWGGALWRRRADCAPRSMPRHRPVDCARGRYLGRVRRTDRGQAPQPFVSGGGRHRRAHPGFRTPRASAKRHLVLYSDALTSFADAPDRLFCEIDQGVARSAGGSTPHEVRFFPRCSSDLSHKHPLVRSSSVLRADGERSSRSCC